jgi:multiple sugar transport system permease protein
VSALAPAQPGEAARGLARASVRARWAHGTVHAALLFVAGLSLIPLVYMVSTSLKAEGLEYEFPIRWIPDPVVLGNYAQAFSSVPTMTFLRNTLIVSLTTIAGELLTGSLAAYGFARLRFPGRNVLFMVMLSTLMLPYFVTMIPLFVLFKTLGWTNTLLPLIVPSFFGGRPIAIFLLRQFFLTLPTELDDAAKIDGAGFFRIWWSVLMPLTRPALATVAILSLVYHWNDFLAPLIYLNSENNFTLALGIRLFRDQYRTFFNLTMAYATMMTLPILTVFFLFQKYFIRGISMSGLTGR